MRLHSVFPRYYFFCVLYRGLNSGLIPSATSPAPFFFFHYCCAGMGAHCGIDTGSYYVSNVSYMSSSSPLLSFTLSYPNSWSSFSRYHFCIYILVYTLPFFLEVFFEIGSCELFSQAGFKL
jgi:hypothetical protein